MALVPLLIALEASRKSFLLGWLFGLSFWLVSVSWIAPTLETYGSLPRWLAFAGLGLLASVLALYTGLFGTVARRLGPLSGWSLVVLPALWVLLEWLRGHLLTGFPWNLAAYAWVDMPGARELSSWVGSHGVSFVVVAVNVGLALMLFHRRWALGTAALLLCSTSLATASRWGHPESESGKGPRRVVIVQPNTAIETEWNASFFEASYRELLQMTRAACSGGLIVWPESAAFPYTFDDYEFLRTDLHELASRGCPVLFNTARREGDHTFNSAMLVSEEGADRQDKRHLVPFGEYVPLAGLVPGLRQLARNAGGFSASPDIRLLAWEGEKIGVSVCFEITFPGEVAALVKRGATVLATLTNDAWYGDSAAPWQHLRAAQFRASENRRPLLRAAITGVSALIDSRGAIVDSLGVGEVGVLEGTVAGHEEFSLFSRAPWLTPAACSIVLIACGVLRWRRRP